MTVMARGAWSRTAWLAMSIRESFNGTDDPMDSDPFGLFPEETTVSDAIPYNPAILQSIHDSGKMAGG